MIAVLAAFLMPERANRPASLTPERANRPIVLFSRHPERSEGSAFRLRDHFSDRSRAGVRESRRLASSRAQRGICFSAATSFFRPVKHRRAGIAASGELLADEQNKLKPRTKNQEQIARRARDDARLNQMCSRSSVRRCVSSRGSSLVPRERRLAQAAVAPAAVARGSSLVPRPARLPGCAARALSSTPL